MEQNDLFYSFCNQDCDFGVYVFSVVSTEEHTYRSWRSDSTNYKGYYLNALEMTPSGFISEVLDFLLDHYANIFIYRYHIVTAYSYFYSTKNNNELLCL